MNPCSILEQINNTTTDNITLKEAKKLLDNCKENKLSLVISRDTLSVFNASNNVLINNRFLTDNGNYINGHHIRNNSNLSGGGASNGGSSSNANIYTTNQSSHQRWPSANAMTNGADHNGKTMAANDAIYASADGSAGGSSSSGDVPPTMNASLECNAPVNESTPPDSMVSARPVNGGWSNQNLYVQQPTRSLETNKNQAVPATMPNGHDNGSDTLHADTVPVPINPNRNQPFDTPSKLDSSVRSHQAVAGVEALCSPSESTLPPLPQQINTVPATHNNNNLSSSSSFRQINADNQASMECDSKSKQTPYTPGEVRYISFQKEGSVGIRLTGGNEVGIFVTAVQPGSPASIQGLQVGDKILKANSTDMAGFTREEAVLYLLKIQDKIDLVVQNCKEEYQDIVANQKGDSFYIRVHFNYDSEGKGELSFHMGDVFRVVDTLFNGVVGSWFVYRLGRNNQEIQKGSIPNQSRADELAAEQYLENKSKSKSMSGTDLNVTEGSSKRGNFFKRRRSARRSKSLSKDHWEDVVFGDGTNSNFPAYERVTLQSVNFTRPIVFFGPLADIAREKLLRDFGDKYAIPQAYNANDADESSSKRSKRIGSSGIIRLSSIKDVLSQNKHALLDITPSAVDRLNYAQYYPIVIFMRAENKSIVKELRSRSSSKTTVHRSSRKLFEQSVKLEKIWYHIFTSSITLSNGGDLWYKKLREIIEKQQLQSIWMSEKKPDENIADDFLFPMISRLSYASSPESDLDISANDAPQDEEDEKEGFTANGSVGNRMVKSSSDPSLAPGENVVDIKAKVTRDGSKVGKNKSSDKLPLHILLKKELSKALNYDKNKNSIPSNEPNSCPESQNNQNESTLATVSSNDYPTLKVGDQHSKNSSRSTFVHVADCPPSPPKTLPPESSTPKLQPLMETPPRIDRNSKPSRFRSAHERLFGNSKSSLFGSVPPTPQIPPPHVVNGTNNNIYQMDDSDYINTLAPIAKFEDQNNNDISSSKVTPQPNGHSTSSQRYVTGAFGDTSSYSSDSYNKYGSPGSTLEPKSSSSRNVPSQASMNDPYRYTRSTTLPINSPKSSSLEKCKPLPPPPLPASSVPSTAFTQPPLTSTFSKVPPSPPPKPAYKYGGLQYQM